MGVTESGGAEQGQDLQGGKCLAELKQGGIEIGRRKLGDIQSVGKKDPEKR